MLRPRRQAGSTDYHKSRHLTLPPTHSYPSAEGLICYCFIFHFSCLPTFMVLKSFVFLSILSWWYQQQTLRKEQQAQGIENIDSFNTFSSKQKLQKALKSWSNFSLDLFGKGQEIYKQLWQFRANSCILTNPCINFDISM